MLVLPIFTLASKKPVKRSVCPRFCRNAEFCDFQRCADRKPRVLDVHHYFSIIFECAGFPLESTAIDCFWEVVSRSQTLMLAAAREFSIMLDLGYQNDSFALQQFG